MNNPFVILWELNIGLLNGLNDLSDFIFQEYSVLGIQFSVWNTIVNPFVLTVVIIAVIGKKLVPLS